MIAALQASLEWVNAHPHWALLLLFAAALLDALFIVGVFVPAGIALFAAGALVAFGTLEFWHTASVAAAGALLGDSLSFWLGRRYGERLFTGPLLQRYPEVVLNGRRFFARYGGYSIALARFLGPVRAVVPALAGAAGLRAGVFAVADLLSSALWAITFILPGVAFGASLGLAAEVAGRLALLLLALISVLLLAWWLTRLAIRAAQRHAEDWIGGLLDWSRRHRRLGVFGAALADPQQPETPVLALLAMLLLGLSAAWLWLWAGPSLHAYPSALDAALFQTLRDLHTPWGLVLAERLLQFGAWTVYAPLVLVTFACLAGLRRRRAAAHWVAAVAFGALLSAGLYAVPTLPPPFAFFGSVPPAGDTAPDLVLATVIYAFLPLLLSTGRKAQIRTLFYGAAVTVLTLTVLARLYLGVQWFSLAMFSVLVGAIWAGLLGLGFRRHRPERLPARKVLAPLLLTFAACLILAWSDPRPQPQRPQQVELMLSADDWHDDGWRQLPAHRVDIAGRDKQPLALQWAGRLEDIAATLAPAGWTPPPALSAETMLRWLTRTTPVADLPILPQVHAGQHPALTLRQVRGAQTADLLRLWPTDYRLDDGRPLWVGSLTRIEAQDRYRLLRYPVGSDEGVVMETILAGITGIGADRHGSFWLLSLAPAAQPLPALPACSPDPPCPTED